MLCIPCLIYTKLRYRITPAPFTWSGTITTKAGRVYPFENKDIVKGSDMSPASAPVPPKSSWAPSMRQSSVSLFSDVDRYSLEDAEVRLNFHMSLPDGNTEDVPMGIFYVAEANRQIKTLELKAYDAMLNFERPTTRISPAATLFDFPDRDVYFLPCGAFPDAGRNRSPAKWHRASWRLPG